MQYGDGAQVVRAINEEVEEDNDVEVLVTDLEGMQQSASQNVDLAAGISLAAEMLAFGDS